MPEPSSNTNDVVVSSSYCPTTFVRQLDHTLARLGDDPHPPPPSTAVEESWIRSFAPKHLEGPFQELYSILYPCLRPRHSPTEDATTASAIVMGPRGSGKSLLVERCLAACQYAAKQQQQQQAKDKVPFRKVQVNGVVVRGEDVPTVVYEIIRQLSDIAMHQELVPQRADSSTERIHGDAANHNENTDTTTNSASPSPRKRQRRNKQQQQDEYLLRLRKSTFTSNLALLESTLKMAEVDRIPIVLILDELDTFILNSKQPDQQQHRQLLLYHLLDRVATPGSNLTLIGITSNFTALTQMEKRIRSRAEGTSKIIFVRPPATFDQLLQILIQDKLLPCPFLQEEISKLLSPTDSGGGTTSSTSPQNEALWITNALHREFRMGRDIRWFCRVFSTAISLYRLSCVLDAAENAPTTFVPDYFMEALAMMGCVNISDEPAVSATKQSNICLVEGVAVDPRLQASLLDLSQPQMALVLAARRILARQAHLEQAIIVTTTSDDTVGGIAPLTLQRMVKEYQLFRKTAKEEVLIEAAQQLLERGVLVPSLDHSGAGPLQYHISMSYQTLDPYSLMRLPLHFPVAMERELEDALNRNLLNCSAALKEWGRKTN